MAFADACADVDVFMAFVPELDWHKAHQQDIERLAKRARGLPEGLLLIFEDEHGLDQLASYWEPVLDAFGERGDLPVRLAALDVLTYRTRDPGAWERQLRHALTDPDPRIRFRALRPQRSGYFRPSRQAMVRLARESLDGEAVAWIHGGALRTMVRPQLTEDGGWTVDSPATVHGAISDPAFLV